MKLSNLPPGVTDADIEAQVGSDYRVGNHGSVCMVHPISQEAKEWLAENVADQQWFGSSLAVHPRLLANLVAGMEDAGLVQE